MGILPVASAGPTSAVSGASQSAVSDQAALVTTRFFLSPGANPAGERGWQSAFENDRVMLDLDNFGHLQSLENLRAGNLSIRLNANQAADGQVVVSSDFAYPGRVFHSALHNGCAADSGVSGGKLRFDFSQPVAGFGLWLFDGNITKQDSFRMIVTDAQGKVWCSRVLESGNGFDLAVEGFIGVQSGVGIRRVVIQAGHWNGTQFQLQDTDFYVDSLQCVVPAPAAGVLGALGLGIAGRLKRRV